MISNVLEQPQQVPKWLSEHARDPDRVLNFCLRHSILPEVKTAVEIAKATFLSLLGLEVYIVQDPEMNQESVEINIRLHGEVDEFIETCDRCIDQWVSRVPAQALTHFHLSYDLS